MVVRLPLVWLVALCLMALAGCTEPTADAPSDNLPSDDIPRSEEESAPAGDQVKGYLNMTYANLAVPISVGTPVYSFNAVDVTHLYLAGNSTGVIVEIAWEPVSPAQDELAIWIRAHDAQGPTGTIADSLLDPEPQFRASGASPIRLTVPAEELPDPAGYSVFVRAAADPAGAGIDQPITTHVVVFEGLPFDPSFTIFGS